MDIETVKDYLSDNRLRPEFFDLAKEVFGIDLAPWYGAGFSTDYHPYSALVNGVMAANVSANVMDCTLDGRSRRYIQFGTVMTKREYRGLGLSRMLMEAAQNDARDCDGMYLYANDSVREFYPRFGFTKALEYRYGADVANRKPMSADHVPMDTRERQERFIEQIRARRDLAVPAIKGESVLMFYLTGFMSGDVWYLPTHDAYAVASIEDGVLTLFALYAPRSVNILETAEAFGEKVKRIELAFTPENPAGLTLHEHKEEDTTFFICGDGLARDMKRILAFPEITHA